MENHVVCVPYPAQGHIKPMLKLAQLLHFIFGFHVTFINTHYIHKTYFQNHPSPSFYSSNNAPIFKFESFPQSFDCDSNDLLSLITAILNDELKLSLKEILMSKLCSSSSSSSSNNNSRLCCMISDVAMSSFTLGVAQELGIRAVLLETASASSLLAYFHTRHLLDKGIIPLRDKSDLTNGYLEKAINWIPSLKGVCLKDMPTSIRTTNSDDMFLNITILNSNRALNSETTTIINTFDALEQDVLRELYNISPNIYPIGPLHSMVEHHISKNNGDTISIGPTILSEEDEHIMKWLNSQEPKSVLYVCFGTLVGVTQETLMELAWGLANSHFNFLWIIRPNLVIGERNSLEFDRFEKEVEGRGVLASWCDQERVLDHPSIGGFLTHCGWNSTIESISNGVPMICWPFVADQMTNSWRCCHGLGIGVKMSEEVQRNAIEKVVKEFMQEQKGEEIRACAMRWKERAKEAILKPHGSSYVNLDSLVKNIIKI